MPRPTARSAADYLPSRITLPMLRKAAAHCRGCDLYKRATQTVFGEGTRVVRLMFIGEQPGDEEDQQGRPFVGPAGRLLAAVLDEVRIDRREVYVTNAVKHFKWKPGTGTRKRIHEKPSAAEVRACHPWLAAELHAVKPALVVALGATAAHSLLGPTFRLTKARGTLLELPAGASGVIDAAAASPRVMATYHPSAILRAPDHDARARMRAEFTADLARAAGYAGLK